jgi:hypothetical protein
MCPKAPLPVGSSILRALFLIERRMSALRNAAASLASTRPLPADRRAAIKRIVTAHSSTDEPSSVPCLRVCARVCPLRRSAAHCVIQYLRARAHWPRAAGAPLAALSSVAG